MLQALLMGGLCFSLIGSLASCRGDVSVPDESVVAAAPSEELLVAGYLEGENMHLLFRYATDQPSWYHQYWVYEAGEWVRYGSGADGGDAYGLYEDRISVMWDDDSVDGFAQIGGFATVHPGMRDTRSAVGSDEVRAHPYLGGELGRSDVRKFIRESRDEESEEPLWSAVKSPAELRALREEGRFLDLWQWRAHRSNPVGYADNGYVLEYRHSSQGRAMFTNNVHPEHGGPQMMFDPAQTGIRALSFDKLIAREYGQADRYYLEESFAIPFDPEHAWREGDALPHRLLREPDGSRGAIRAAGVFKDGAWQVHLTRSLESPNPLDSISFTEGEVFWAAFAVHSGAGGADHLVSMPVAIGFNTEATIHLSRYNDRAPDPSQLEWHSVQLFDPGDP